MTQDNVHRVLNPRKLKPSNERLDEFSTAPGIVIRPCLQWVGRLRIASAYSRARNTEGGTTTVLPILKMRTSMHTTRTTLGTRKDAVANCKQSSTEDGLSYEKETNELDQRNGDLR